MSAARLLFYYLCASKPKCFLIFSRKKEIFEHFHSLIHAMKVEGELCCQALKNYHKNASKFSEQGITLHEEETEIQVDGNQGYYS